MMKNELVLRDILFVVPSMGREDVIRKSVVLEYSKYFPIHVVVFESEVESYEKAVPEAIIHGIPDSILGKQRKLNWILENLFTEDYTAMFTMDDDVRKFMWVFGPKFVTISPQDFMNVLLEDTELCMEFQAKVFSLDYSKGPKFTNRMKPISINTSILGGAMCILDHRLRFDTNIMLAEDVDVVYMEQFKRGIVWRDQRIAMDPLIPINAGDGGQTQYRSTERIRHTRQYLRNKYGAWVKVDRAV